MTSHVTDADIDVAFRSILGRSPESEKISMYFRQFSNIDDVINEIKSSPEARTLHGSLALADPLSPFWHYNSSFDAQAVVKSHEAHSRKAIDGRLVNFLGVSIDPAIYPPLLHGREGELEAIPLPANWHADIAEFAAALRAVDLAKESFRVLELGCGWGCWLLNTGTAARNRGLKVKLIGVEGDSGHVQFARDAAIENGFDTSEVNIIQGIVGPMEGTALFPNQTTAGGSWGLEPIFDATPDQIAAAADRYNVLPIITLNSLAADNEVLDLVHLDIQGGETDFIRNCISQLTDKAAYVLVGTHSRVIEGEIMKIMLDNDWLLEIERPAIFSIEDGKPLTRCDGVQGWRNRRLRPF